MGFDDTGYDQQKLQYETGETRPVNPPTIVGGTIAMSDEVDYDLSVFVKNVPPTGTFSIDIQDAEGNLYKNVADGISSIDGQYLYFSYNDYQTAIDNGRDLAPLPQAQTINAYLVSILDDTDEQKRVPLVMVPDVACWQSFELAAVEVAQGETFPYVVAADDFVSVAGGLSDFELSADDGVTWSADYEIAEAPTMDVQVPFLVRALTPCVTAGVGTYFIRLGPS